MGEYFPSAEKQLEYAAVQADWAGQVIRFGNDIDFSETPFAFQRMYFF